MYIFRFQSYGCSLGVWCCEGDRVYHINIDGGHTTPRHYICIHNGQHTFIIIRLMCSVVTYMRPQWQPDVCFCVFIYFMGRIRVMCTLSTLMSKCTLISHNLNKAKYAKNLCEVLQKS